MNELVLIPFAVWVLVFLSSLIQLIQGGREEAGRAQNKIAACVMAGVVIVAAVPVTTWALDIKTYGLNNYLDREGNVVPAYSDQVAYTPGTFYYRGATVTNDKGLVDAIDEGRCLPFGGIIDKVFTVFYVFGGILVAIGFIVAAILLRANPEMFRAPKH
jgi:hypothetical protein